MADKTIDQLDPGGAAEASDTLPIERAGLNYFLTISAIAAFVNANLNVVKTANSGVGVTVDNTDPENPVFNSNVGTDQGDIVQFGAPEYGLPSYPLNYGGNIKAFTVLPNRQGKTASIDVIVSCIEQLIALPGKVNQIVISTDTALSSSESLPRILVVDPTVDQLKLSLPQMSSNGNMPPLSVGQEFSIINTSENEFALDILDFDGNVLQNIKPLEMYSFVVQDVSTPAGEFLPYGRLLFIISPTRGLLSGVVELNTDDIETKTGAINTFLNTQTVLQPNEEYQGFRLNKVVNDTQLINLNYFESYIIPLWELNDERVICPIGYSQGGIVTVFFLTQDSSEPPSRFGFTAQLNFGDDKTGQFNFTILSFNTDGVIFDTVQDFINRFTFKFYRMPDSSGLLTMTNLIADLPTDSGFTIYVSLNAGLSLYQQSTPHIGLQLKTLAIQPITTGISFVPDVYATDDTGAQEEFTWTPVDATGTVTLSNAFGTGIKRGNEVELYFTGVYPATSSNSFVQINGWNSIYNPKDNSGIGTCVISANSPTNTFPNQVGVLSSSRLSLTCNGYQSKLSDVSGQLFRGKISYLIND